jgi:hypothetical protein
MPQKKKDVSESYNRYKLDSEGKQYTGMSIGRSHKWNYDSGVWHDTKIAPDLWEIAYSVTKRRAGHAPKGSGASVGTDYHWFIIAHQHVEKLNADDYSTALTGLKFKLAHKRADKDKWNTTAKTQRKHLIEFLQSMIEQLEQEAIPLEFTLGDKLYEGEALPVMESCHEGVCFEYEITLNNKNLGMIRRLKSGWKMWLVTDNKLIRAVGKAIEEAEGEAK